MTLNKLSAEVWNYCVKIDKEYYKQNQEYMNLNKIQTAVKGFNGLHAKGINFVYHRYIIARSNAFKSIKKKHDESNKVKLPYKIKKFYNTGWDYQSINIDYENNIISLCRPVEQILDNPKRKYKRQSMVKCHSKSIPKNIVEIELLYRNKLYLCIKYKEENINDLIQSNNVASIDLGEIHTITSIDNNGNAIIITGRKMRSIKQLRNKEMANLRTKMTKCKKYSRQWKKYNHALWNLSYKTNRQILDCVHKITKLYLDFCLENNISKVYYGDLDNCTRGRRVGNFVGEKLNQWNYGEIMKQLHNKLERYGIELIEIKEYYSSQKCPQCKNLHKPTGRNYNCMICGYVQHRDIVGAMNILNDNHNSKIIRYETKKYLQIA